MSRGRFIAGAECAYCHGLDRVILLQNEAGQTTGRACLACGREDGMPENAGANAGMDAIQHDEPTPIRLIE